MGETRESRIVMRTKIQKKIPGIEWRLNSIKYLTSRAADVFVDRLIDENMILRIKKY